MIGLRSSSKTSGDTLPSFMSHGEGYFHFFTNVDVNSANYAFGFIIERPFSNGAPTAEGSCTTPISGATSNTRQVIPHPERSRPMYQGSGFGGAGDVASDERGGADYLGRHKLRDRARHLSAGNGQRFTCAAVYNRSGDLSADLVMLDGSANPKVTMWGSLGRILRSATRSAELR